MKIDSTVAAAGGAAVHLPSATPALPETWPDALDLRRPADLWRFLRKVLLRKVGRVQLPANLPLNVPLPKYLLLEFHNLPNGNYSRKITRGYSTGFDIVMLGEMRYARAALAAGFAGCARVADIGCGAGYSTQALHEAGVADVVGIDASPYLLEHAAAAYPQLRFTQGLAERTLLADASLDGISCCYLFHEIPPGHADRALDEFRRVLKPGGQLAFLEPAAEQFYGRFWTLLRRHGWRGLYFSWLARFVHEPFVRAWHRRDIGRWLASHGFELVDDRLLFPSRLIRARLRPDR